MVDKSATQTLVRERTGRDPEDLVRELYVERRYSDREIAAAIGVNRVTVTKWRRLWQISRSDRVGADGALA